MVGDANKNVNVSVNLNANVCALQSLLAWAQASKCARFGPSKPINLARGRVVCVCGRQSARRLMILGSLKLASTCWQATVSKPASQPAKTCEQSCLQSWGQTGKSGRFGPSKLCKLSGLNGAQWLALNRLTGHGFPLLRARR